MTSEALKREGAGPWAGPLALIDAASRSRLLIILAAVMVSCVFFAGQSQWLKWHDGYVFAILAHGVFYAMAVWVVLTVRLSARALLLILAVAALLRCIAFVVPVGLTTDGFRYVWDGRLQAAGVNPYLTVPADPRLAHLRDTTIYPNINGKDTLMQSLGTVINTPAFDGDFYIAPDESYMIVSAKETKDYESELWISFRKKDQTWTAPQSLGGQINTGLAHRFGQYVSPDGKYLFYTKGTSEADCNIYWVRIDKTIAQLRKSAGL